MLTSVPARDTLTIPEGAAAGAAARLTARGALRVIGSTTSDVHAVTAAMAINSAPAASGDVTVERIMGHLLWVGFGFATRSPGARRRSPFTGRASVRCLTYPWAAIA